MLWNLSGDRPIYLQLMEQLKYQILSGKYQLGDHIPSVRDLAAEAAVNPNTMQKALAALEQEGLLVNGRTTGRTVTTDESMILNMRRDLAATVLSDFQHSLNRLGFSEEEIREFIRNEYQLN
ncbi:MAG: GntR family transcriptional regulator [Lachnospiraceae bacterium]|nr:GntR family transcriptional regulator [Lachnospiraceae bacterium]